MRKTRKALLDAFAALVQSRHYDKIRVADIIDDADVGRSTFYEHYRGKDDLLLISMSGILDVFAGAVSETCDLARLEFVLNHLWENRGMARYLLAGPPAQFVAPRVARELADRIETRLRTACRPPGSAPALPIHLIAVPLAEAQLALLRAWLAGESSCAPGALAVGMRRSSRGAVSALLASRRAGE